VSAGVGPHAHVERGALTKAETARRRVDLPRGDAEVEQDAVEALVADRRALEVSVIAQERKKATGADVRGEPVQRLGDGLGVAVNRGHTTNAGFEQGEGVPAAAERSVEDGGGAREAS